MRPIPAVGDAQYQYYFAQCANKEQFDSVTLANKVLKTRKVSSARQVYKCEFCGKWHLGSATRGKYVKPYQRD